MDEREDAEHSGFRRAHMFHEKHYISSVTAIKSGDRLQHDLFRGALNEVTSQHWNVTRLDRQGVWRFPSAAIPANMTNYEISRART